MIRLLVLHLDTFSSVFPGCC